MSDSSLYQQLIDDYFTSVPIPPPPPPPTSSSQSSLTAIPPISLPSASSRNDTSDDVELIPTSRIGELERQVFEYVFPLNEA
jgi:hypothetical protein